MSKSTQPSSTKSPSLQKRLTQWFIRGSQVVKNLLIRPLSLVFSPLHRFLLKLNTLRFRYTTSPSLPPAPLPAPASHRDDNFLSHTLQTLIRIPRPFRRISTPPPPQASCPDLFPYLHEAAYNQPPMTAMIVYPSCSEIPTRTNADLTRNPLAAIRQHLLAWIPFQPKDKRSLGVAYPPLPVSLLPYCVSIKMSPNTSIQPWKDQFLLNPKDILEIRAVHCGQLHRPYSQNQTEYYFTPHNASLVVYSGYGSAEKKTSGRNYPVVVRPPQRGPYGPNILKLFSLLISFYFFIEAGKQFFAPRADQQKKRTLNQSLIQNPSSPSPSPSSVAQLGLRGCDSDEDRAEKDHPSEKDDPSANDQLSPSHSNSDDLQPSKSNNTLTTEAGQSLISTDTHHSEHVRSTTPIVDSSFPIGNNIHPDLESSTLTITAPPPSPTSASWQQSPLHSDLKEDSPPKVSTCSHTNPLVEEPTLSSPAQRTARSSDLSAPAGKEKAKGPSNGHDAPSTELQKSGRSDMSAERENANDAQHFVPASLGQDDSNNPHTCSDQSLADTEALPPHPSSPPLSHAREATFPINEADISIANSHARAQNGSFAAVASCQPATWQTNPVKTTHGNVLTSASTFVTTLPQPHGAIQGPKLSLSAAQIASSSSFSPSQGKDKATDTGTGEETLSAEPHHSRKSPGHNSVRGDMQAEGKQASPNKHDDTLLGAASSEDNKQHNTSTHSNDSESKEQGSNASQTSQSDQSRDSGLVIDSGRALPDVITLTFEDDDKMSEVSDGSFDDDLNDHNNSALADSSQPAFTHTDPHPTRDSLSATHAKSTPPGLIRPHLHFTQPARDDANSVSTGSGSEDDTSEYDDPTRNPTLSQSSQSSSSTPPGLIRPNLHFTQSARDDANSVSSGSGSEDDTSEYDDPTRNRTLSQPSLKNPHGLIRPHLHFTQSERDDANSVSTGSGSEDDTSEYDDPTVIDDITQKVPHVTRPQR